MYQSTLRPNDKQIQLVTVLVFYKLCIMKCIKKATEILGINITLNVNMETLVTSDKYIASVDRQRLKKVC